MTDSIRALETVSDTLHLEDAPLRKIAIDLHLAHCLASIVLQYVPARRSLFMQGRSPTTKVTGPVHRGDENSLNKSKVVPSEPDDPVHEIVTVIERLSAGAGQIAALLRHDVPHPRDDQARAVAFGQRVRGAIASDRPLPTLEESLQFYDRLSELANARGEPKPSRATPIGTRRTQGRGLSPQDIAHGLVLILEGHTKSQRSLAVELGVSQSTVQRCAPFRFAFAQRAPRSTGRVVQGADGSFDAYEEDARVDSRIDRNRKSR